MTTSTPEARAERALPPAATYVYCVLRAGTTPALEGAPAGLEGAGPARLLALAPGRWLVVADAPLERYGEAAIQRGLSDLEWVGPRALEHEALVEHLLARGTVVPMKLFSLFLGDERALADARGRAARLDALLDAFEGRREYGLRVLVDPDAASAAARARAEREQAGASSAGHAFLLRKKSLHDAERHLGAELRARARALYEELAPLSADARARAPSRAEGRLVLDASFLVQDDAAQAFQAAVAAGAQALAPRGLTLQLSGPWPAYNFVEPAP